MSDTKTDAVNNVAQLLHRFESLIDEVVTCGGELTAAMPIARREAQLPALAGQHALGCMGEALSAVIEARRHTVAAHKHLDKTRELMGLPEIGFGDVTPKAIFEPTHSTNEAPLRAVG